MNIAIELDPKIYDKAQKEKVFIPIKNEMRKPDSKQREQKKKNRMLLKERRALNHLSKTCSLISNLNNDDLTMMRNLKEKEIEKEDRQRGN